jgi:dynein light intermediate chain 2
LPNPVVFSCWCFSFSSSRYDLFANEDPAKRRVLISALRFVAHTSGASLYCTSSRDKSLSAHYRSMMNNACFGIAPQRGTQLDPSKPVICNFGSDSLSDIGSPPGASTSEYESGRSTRLSKWKAAVEDFNIYPAEEDEMMDAILKDVDDGAFPESAVDGVRSEHDDNLVRYRKDVERKARLNA